MPSYQVGGTCYPTKGAAARAFTSEAEPSGFYVNSQWYQCVYVQQGTEDSPSIQRHCGYMNGSTWVPAALNHTPIVPYMAVPCGLIDHADATAIAWQVAAVWLAVFGVARVLRKAFGK